MTTNSTQELLPCPFAAGHECVVESYEGATGQQYYPTCNADGCPANIVTPMLSYATKREAIAAWNTRATSAPAGEVVLPSWLMSSAQALLNLDANGSLVPHGIGGHARSIIQAFIDAHTAIPAPSVVGEDEAVQLMLQAYLYHKDATIWKPVDRLRMAYRALLEKFNITKKE